MKTAIISRVSASMALLLTLGLPALTQGNGLDLQRTEGNVVMTTPTATVQFLGNRGAVAHWSDASGTALTGAADYQAMGVRLATTAGAAAWQVGPNPVTPYRIGDFGALRESAFNLSDQQAVYEVQGPLPLLWGLDDVQNAIPPDSLDRWEPAYEVEDPENARYGAPLFFHGGDRSAGALFFGKESRNPGGPWNQELVSLTGKRVTARISFAEAGSGSPQAGLILKNITTAMRTTAQAIAAEGYELRVDRNGSLYLYRSVASTGTRLVWSAARAAPVQSPEGVEIGFYTSASDPGSFALLVDGRRIGGWRDPNPVRATHIGLRASLRDEGRILFGDRTVSDTSVQAVIRYTGLGEGDILQEVRIVTLPVARGGQQAPAFFASALCGVTILTDDPLVAALNSRLQPISRFIDPETGQEVDGLENPTREGARLMRLRAAANPPHHRAHWLFSGSGDLSTGLWASPEVLQIDGQSPAAGGLGWIDPVTGELQLGPLSYESANRSVAARSLRQVTRLRTVAPQIATRIECDNLDTAFGRLVRYRARLLDVDGAQLADQVLILTAGEIEVGEAVTGPDGWAEWVFRMELDPGAHALSVRFAGNDPYGSSAAEAKLSVARGRSRLGTEAPARAFAGDSIDGNAALTDDEGNPLPDQPVELFVDGEPGDTVYTGEDGTAPFSLTLLAGRHTIRAVFAGDERIEGSSAETVVEVVKRATRLLMALSPDRGTFGEFVTVEVLALDQYDNPVPYAEVVLHRPGAEPETWTTDEWGMVVAEWPIEESVGLGSRPIQATLLENDHYTGSSASANLEVVRGASELSLSLDAGEVPYAGMLEGGGTLIRQSDGAPLANRTVIIRRGNEEIARVVTDGEGNYRFAVKALWRPRSYPIRATCESDALYDGSAAEETLRVTKTAVTFEMRDARGSRSDTVALRCWVRRASDGEPVEGILIEWYLDREYIRSDRTNPSGYSAIGLPLAGRNTGTRRIRAVFDGDTYHLGGEGNATLTIR